LTWRSALLDGLSASLNYTFVDAEFTSFNLAEILAPVGGAPSAFNRAKAGNNDGDFSGNVPALTPENSASFSLRYDRNPSSESRFYIEAIALYMDERFIGEDNHAWLPSYTEVDLYLGYGRNNWDLTLYVVNATDDDTIKSGVGNVDYGFLPDGRSVPSAASLYLPQPRTAGVRFEMGFGN